VDVSTLDCLLHSGLAEAGCTLEPTFTPRWPQYRLDNRDRAMISLDFNFNILTRDLSHDLENQVKVGLFGSGVGLSLVLGFSAAYTCYYLLSVAKVSTGSLNGSSALMKPGVCIIITIIIVIPITTRLM